MHCLLQLLSLATLCVVCLSNSTESNVTTSKCGEKEKAAALLDVAKDFMNKAKEHYPTCIDTNSSCGEKEKSFAFLDVAANLIAEVEKNYPSCPDPVVDPECPEIVERPVDCGEVLKSGRNASGVYDIWPRSRLTHNESISVYCDMETEGGGWTVIQRRGNFSTPKDYFYKDWQNYKKGFGNVTEEFWIGNDNIHAISNQGNYTVRFDLESEEGEKKYAEYNFWIEDEAANYTLHIDGYNGDAGDAMSGVDRMKFTTKDRKNDEHTVNCAIDKLSAWWFKACTWANLNGINTPGRESRSGMTWYQFNNTWVTLARVEIKLRA